MHSSSINRFTQAYRDLCRTLSLPGANDPSIDQLQLVTNYLNDQEQWLFILDNADDLDVLFSKSNNLLKPLFEYLPRTSNGRVLITTRDRRVGERLTGRSTCLDILPNAAEAALLLQSKLPEATTDPVASASLLQGLDYLPLAITQATAFICESNISLAEYVRLMEEGDGSDTAALLSQDSGDIRRDSESYNSVFKTWKISFDKIREHYPRAAEIMSLMAVMDRQSIPEMLLKNDDERETDFKISIAPLRSFSLIQSEMSQTSFEVHRLVHLAVQQWLRHEKTWFAYQAKAFNIVSRVFDLRDWKTCETLYPHAQVLASQPFRNHGYKAQTDYASLLHSTAHYIRNRHGNHRLAHTYCTTALEIQEGVLGPRSPDAVVTRLTLAFLLSDLGDDAGSLELCRRVVAESKEVFGLEDLRTLHAKTFIADRLRDLQAFHEAETLYRQVSAGFKAVEGRNSWLWLNCQEGLALCLVSNWFSDMLCLTHWVNHL